MTKTIKAMFLLLDYSSMWLVGALGQLPHLPHGKSGTGNEWWSKPRNRKCKRDGGCTCELVEKRLMPKDEQFGINCKTRENHGGSLLPPINHELLEYWCIARPKHQSLPLPMKTHSRWCAVSYKNKRWTHGNVVKPKLQVKTTWIRLPIICELE